LCHQLQMALWQVGNAPVAIPIGHADAPGDELSSAMSIPDMEADENGVHTGWLSQRDEIVAYWCHKPEGEADPGAFPDE